MLLFYQPCYNNINSNNLSDESLNFSEDKILLCEKKWIFVSSFPVLNTFHSFSCLTVLSNISSIALNLICFKFESPSKYSSHSQSLNTLPTNFQGSHLILEQFCWEGLNTQIHNILCIFLVLIFVKPRHQLAPFLPCGNPEPQCPGLLNSKIFDTHSCC